MEDHSKQVMEESSKLIPLLTNSIDDTNTSQRFSLILLNEFNHLSFKRSKSGFINGLTSSLDVDALEYV
jgi:hypothetical protein